MRIKNQFHPLYAMVMIIYFAATLMLVTSLNDTLAVVGLYIFVPGLFNPPKHFQNELSL